MLEVGRHMLATEHGDLLVIGHLFGDGQQVVLSAARIPSVRDDRPWKLRVQYGCAYATIFHATDCDCGKQIRNSLDEIASYGKGIFVYFRDHEAFGLGLAEKMRIVAEEIRLGLPYDAVLRREKRRQPPASTIMWAVPKILEAIGIPRTDPFVLLSSNPEKLQSLCAEGLLIERTTDI